jgi:hypothetical protein
VKITGTNISTTTDGQGQFTLTGVPPGNVQLEFSGQGTNAKIVISGITAQDEIRISVTVNGNNAHVDSEHHSGRDDHKDQNDRKDQNDVSGPVATLSGTCPTLAFIVQGTRVTTTASTAFEGVTCANIKNGVKVNVTGQRGADGTLAATRVRMEDTGNNQGEMKGAVAGLTGTCPNLTFTIQGTKVTTTGSTAFSGITCANIKNGVMVQVKGTRGADGAIAASRVNVEDNGDDNQNEVNGAVSGLSGTCPSLTFTVHGTKVTTTASTIFDGVTCAHVLNGTIVDVKGQRQTDGTVAATRVQLED